MHFHSTAAAEWGKAPFSLPPAESAEPPEPPESWAGIVAREPILGDIAEEAAFIGRSRGRSRTTDLKRLKQRFSLYVGWTSRDPRLCSSAAFETVYRAILSAFERRT